MLRRFYQKYFQAHKPGLGALEIFRYLGPGLVITVGFIDPGNWAANVAAGSEFGYSLLWVVTLSTIILIFLQHNAAHLGIVSGLCLSEAATHFFKKPVSVVFLISAMLASVSTSLAELLGAAIGLNMLFGLPLALGILLVAAVVIAVAFFKGYRLIERYIIGFVSLIGLSFIYELTLADVAWSSALQSAVLPTFPLGSVPIVMSILGAVIMPHNIFLHSEIIQSRQWHLQDEKIIRRQLNLEYVDTIFAMLIGWAINSAMVVMAAAVFFSNQIQVTELQQAEATLRPLLGGNAALVFALALFFAGFSSSVSSALAGGSIFSGLFAEPLDLKDNHSRLGVLISIVGAVCIALMLKDVFGGLIWSQIALSIQLPWTVAALVVLTSSRRVMGKYANPPLEKAVLWLITGTIAVLNLVLLFDLLR